MDRSKSFVKFCKFLIKLEYFSQSLICIIEDHQPVFENLHFCVFGILHLKRKVELEDCVGSVNLTKEIFNFCPKKKKK